MLAAFAEKHNFLCLLPAWKSAEKKNMSNVCLLSSHSEKIAKIKTEIKIFEKINLIKN